MSLHEIPKAHEVLPPQLLIHRGALCAGLSMTYIQEVLLLSKVARIPWAPPWLPGVVQHRGEVVPLIDLGVFVSLDPEPSAQLAALIAHPHNPIALVAEGLSTAVDALPDSAPSPLTTTMHRVQEAWPQLRLHRAGRGPRFYPIDADQLIALVLERLKSFNGLPNIALQAAALGAPSAAETHRS